MRSLWGGEMIDESSQVCRDSIFAIRSSDFDLLTSQKHGTAAQPADKHGIQDNARQYYAHEDIRD